MLSIMNGLKKKSNLKGWSDITDQHLNFGMIFYNGFTLEK